MKCLKDALSGIVGTIARERNMRIHLCFAFYVILAGFVTGIESTQWLAVIFCIGLVTALECLNTAVEGFCDLVCSERSPTVRAVKDAAAGGVLLAAAASGAVGCIIFFSPEKTKTAFDFLTTRPIASSVIILTLVPAVLFVRGSVKGERK